MMHVLRRLHTAVGNAANPHTRAGAAAGSLDDDGRPRGAARGLRLRLLVHILVALLPNSLKVLCYRYFFGFRIGCDVRIGLSVLDVDRCTLGARVRIGHFNVFTRLHELRVGEHARVGFGNLVRGGSLVALGRYCEIVRFNMINAIPEPDAIGRPEPVFVLGDGSVVTAEHRFDFTDRIEVGRRTVVGGRNSSFWTHNRQATLPIHIGEFCYVGSEVRLAPGARIPAWSILGLGSVAVGPVGDQRSLIAGVPAKAVRPLSDADIASLARKTRADLPEDV